MAGRYRIIASYVLTVILDDGMSLMAVSVCKQILFIHSHLVIM